MAEIGKEYRLFNVKYPPRREDTGANVFTPALGDGSGADNTAIQEAIDALSAFRKQRIQPGFIGNDEARIRADNEKKGGTVYFPPGEYRIDPIPLDDYALGTPADGQDAFGPKHRAALYVPPDVTLEFAPGAVLQLMGRTTVSPFALDVPGARVEIAGGLAAGLHKIFDVQWRARRFDGAEDRGVPGAVIFSGVKVAEVFPEWWGATGLGSQAGQVPSWPALQDAFDAAYRDRAAIAAYVRANRAARPPFLPTSVDEYAPIPIRLTQTYWTTRPLILEADVSALTGTDSAFQLLGAQGANTRAGILGQFGSGALDYARQQGVALAVLFVKRAFGFEIRDLSVVVHNSGTETVGPTQVPVPERDWARTGLWVEAGSRTPGIVPPTNRAGVAGVGGAAQMARVHRCAFSSPVANGRLRELVYIGGGIGDPPDGGFEAEDPPKPDAERDRYRRVAYGDDLLGLVFDQCYFKVEGGRFDAAGRLDPTAGNGPEGPDERQYVGRDRALGVVVNAGNALPVQLNTCLFGGYAWRFLDAVTGEVVLHGTGFHNNNRNGVDVFVNRPGAADWGRGTQPVGLTVTHCESQSWSFLASWRGATPALPVPGVTLIACNHNNNQLNYLDDRDGLLDTPQGRVARGRAASDPPSIDWHNGGPLYLLGCNFGSDVNIGPEALYVVDVATKFLLVRGVNGTPTNVRGGRFTGELAKLRGLTGLPTWLDATHQGRALAAPALRMGGNLLLMAATAQSPDYPWQTGDVWLQPLGAGDPIAPFLPRKLDHALHRARVSHLMEVVRRPGDSIGLVFERDVGTTITYEAWEDVFGSENYSGPWVAAWDSFKNELLLDGLIQPQRNSIYEVLWAVTPVWGPLEGNVTAVGRDTITVHDNPTAPAAVPPYCEISTSPNTVGGRSVRTPVRVPSTGGDSLTVGLRALFIRNDGSDPRAAVPVDEVGDGGDARRLRLVFSNILTRPWETPFGRPPSAYRVVVRRLM